MLRSPEEKIIKFNKAIFLKQEENLNKLISGNTSLTNHRLNALSKEVTELRENLQFTQKNIEDKISDFKGSLNATEKD